MSIFTPVKDTHSMVLDPAREVKWKEWYPLVLMLTHNKYEQFFFIQSQLTWFVWWIFQPVKPSFWSERFRILFYQYKNPIIKMRQFYDSPIIIMRIPLPAMDIWSLNQNRLQMPLVWLSLYRLLLKFIYDYWLRMNNITWYHLENGSYFSIMFCDTRCNVLLISLLQCKSDLLQC